MTELQDVHAQLIAINPSAAFNRWCGLEVKSASAGLVGKTQVFTACDLYAAVAQAERLVATGETLLSVIQGPAQATRGTSG